MRYRGWIGLLGIALLVAGSGVSGGDDPPDKGEDQNRLTMTKAIACKTITGFDNYKPLAEAVITRDDKLLVYFEPSGHTIQRLSSGYRAHLIEDVRIRRHGQKPVLWSKDKVVDYKVTSKESPDLLYISTTLGLKGFSAGDYDLDILLHDALAERPTATQTLRFRIKDGP